VKLCELIPDGVVAFFPSYDYLRHILDKWRKCEVAGTNQTIVSQLERRKKLFYEMPDKSDNTEDILQEYSKTIDSGSGALLLSVVGGKLSEGINFSDKLGRAVLIVGLPFPNIRSAVWQAKIQHIEKTSYERNTALTEGNRKAVAKAEGRDFYENACMRAVNKCIGRAIRHRNDYAAIILMDKRYGTERIQAKLPGWIKRGLATNTSILSASEVRDNIKLFFDRRSMNLKVY
jgi:chromosome transmission fidelity protein 1